jgi:hypothetical protein
MRKIHIRQRRAAFQLVIQEVAFIARCALVISRALSLSNTSVAEVVLAQLTGEWLTSLVGRKLVARIARGAFIISFSQLRWDTSLAQFARASLTEEGHTSL